MPKGFYRTEQKKPGKRGSLLNLIKLTPQGQGFEDPMPGPCGRSLGWVLLAAQRVPDCRSYCCLRPAPSCPLAMELPSGS